MWFRTLMFKLANWRVFYWREPEPFPEAEGELDEWWDWQW